MPSGKDPRTPSIAVSTSLTASIRLVPISNSTKVCEEPSRAVDWIELTPAIERSALSTRWVIWFSISVGEAPGWAMLTITAGKSTSGLLVTSMRRKLTIPANSRPVKNTRGITGLRIDQAEMSRSAMIILPVLRCSRLACQLRGKPRAGWAPYFFWTCGLTVSPGLRNPPARSTTFSEPVRPSVIAMPPSVTAPVLTARRAAFLSSPTI